MVSAPAAEVAAGGSTAVAMIEGSLLFNMEAPMTSGNYRRSRRSAGTRGSSISDGAGEPVAERGFEPFFALAEPRLRRALVARYGAERGREAAAEALAWGYEHWDSLAAMRNPVGYLYRVGCSRSRPRKTPPPLAPSGPPAGEPAIEPELMAALARLSRRQREAVVLVYGYGYHLREVADLTGSSTSSVNTHLRRGLRRLRTDLGVIDDQRTS